MGDDVEGPLEATLGVGEEVDVICYTDCSDAAWSKVKTKLGATELQETWVDIDLEITRRNYKQQI